MHLALFDLNKNQNFGRFKKKKKHYENVKLINVNFIKYMVENEFRKIRTEQG